MKFQWMFISLLVFLPEWKAEGGSLPKTPFTPPSPSRLGKFRTAAVSSDAGICSDIGRDILMKGGNAVDTAIATLFCIGVVLPQSCGIGGASLATIYDPATRTATSINAREAAPLAATEDMFHGDSSISQKGPLAAAVPGEVAGSWAAHQAFGRLPWADLIQPSADMADTGIVVTRALASALRQKSDEIKNEPSMDCFLNPETGEVLLEGDVYTRPALANTLRQIARSGADVLYNGPLGDQMVQDIQRRGGIMTKEDLTNYRAELVEPVRVDLNKFQLYSMPPPGSGVLAAYVLNVMESYLGGSPDASDDPLTYHRIAESFKHAYAYRTRLGDPAYVPEVNDLVRNLTSEIWVDETRAKINDSYTSNDPEYYGAVLYTPEDHGTSHVSVIDADGMAVAVTMTVNLFFGAGFMSEQTGIILNDGMDDFSSPNITNHFDVPPSPANFIRPGKRPLSSMTPTVIVHSDTGRVRLVLGAAGGTRITTSVAFSAIRNVWFGETIKQAIDSRRIHHQLFPMNLQYETEDFPKYILDDLAAKGHNNSVMSIGSSVCGIAVEDDGFIYANADNRIGGDVSGIDPVF